MNPINPMRIGRPMVGQYGVPTAPPGVVGQSGAQLNGSLGAAPPPMPPGLIGQTGVSSAPPGLVGQYGAPPNGSFLAAAQPVQAPMLPTRAALPPWMQQRPLMPWERPGGTQGPPMMPPGGSMPMNPMRPTYADHQAMMQQLMAMHAASPPPPSIPPGTPPTSGLGKPEEEEDDSTSR